MKGQANPPLDRLVARERVAQILDALTPAELVVALLRAEGLTDEQIGGFLGVECTVVRQRMKRARRRIGRHVPGAAGLIEGRRR